LEEAQVTTILPGLTLVSERESGRWIDCAPCSAVMAAHAAKASVPATLSAAHRVRSAAGLPHSGGMTAAQVDAGLRLAYGVDLVPVAKADIPAKIAAGYAVVAVLTYGSLPSNLRRWQPSFTGGHSVCLAGTKDGKIGWFDPLAPAGYSGEWTPYSAVDQALWSSGHLMVKRASGAVVAPPAPSTGPTLRYGGKAEGRGHYIVTANGTRVRERPSTSARIVKTVAAGTTLQVGQTTDTGTAVGGSRRWRGTMDGRKWVHDSLVRPSGHSTGREDIR
jgi:hypothetical protein